MLFKLAPVKEFNAIHTTAEEKKMFNKKSEVEKNYFRILFMLVTTYHKFRENSPIWNTEQMLEKQTVLVEKILSQVSSFMDLLAKLVIKVL